MRANRILLLLILFVFSPIPARAAAKTLDSTPPATPASCNEPFVLPSKAFGVVCKPDGWLGDVVVYAHGYVDPTSTKLEFANLEVPQPDGSTFSLPAFAQSFGYAFAATTYRRNGLVVQEGVEDIRELVAALPEKLGRQPRRVFVLGFSEGGIIATLFAERNPLLLDGVLAACGPIGDFGRQTQYFTEFRVLFDYYFPNELPEATTAITIEQSVIDVWDTVYVPKITQLLTTNPISATELITDSGAAIDRTTPTLAAQTTISTTLDVLRYNVFSTNDAREQLGGNPYDSSALRARFPERNLPQYTADITATQALAAYMTTGNVAVPLVTAHTTGDQIVPIVQQELYAAKASGNGFVSHKTIARYGHCNFGFDLLGPFIDLTRQGRNLRRVFLPVAIR